MLRKKPSAYGGSLAGVHVCTCIELYFDLIYPELCASWMESAEAIFLYLKPQSLAKQ